MTSVVELCTEYVSTCIEVEYHSWLTKTICIWCIYTYKQLLGFSSDSDDIDTQLTLSFQTVHKSQVRIELKIDRNQSSV